MKSHKSFAHHQNIMAAQTPTLIAICNSFSLHLEAPSPSKSILLKQQQSLLNWKFPKIMAENVAEENVAEENVADNAAENEGLKPRTLRLFAIVLSVYEFVSSQVNIFMHYIKAAFSSRSRWQSSCWLHIWLSPITRCIMFSRRSSLSKILLSTSKHTIKMLTSSWMTILYSMLNV